MRKSEVAAAVPVVADSALRALGAVALIVGCFVVLWPTTRSLMQAWEDTARQTYTHGYLVILVTLGFVLHARERIAAARPFWPALGLVFAGGLCWLIAIRAGLQIVHQALLPLLTASVLLTVFGPRMLRHFAIPIGFLYFAIPVWDALTPLLQGATVIAVRLLLRMLAIPAFFDGNLIHVPAGVFEIADGCSGLHFFIVSLAIAVVYGEMHQDAWRLRLRLMALAAAFALLTNWLRITVIAVAGHVTDMRHYLVSDEHYTFGWVLFAAAMLAYVLIVRRWPAQSRSAIRVTAVESRALHAPWSAGLLALVMLTAISLSALRAAERVAELPPSLAPAPLGWRSDAVGIGWEPVFHGADAREELRFGNALGEEVEFFAALYTQQRQGKELIGFGNSVLGSTLQAFATSSAGRWNDMHVRDPRGTAWRVRYAYRLDELWYREPLALQLAYGVRSLLAAPLSSVVILRARCSDAACEAAGDTLQRFIVAAWPEKTEHSQTEL